VNHRKPLSEQPLQANNERHDRVVHFQQKHLTTLRGRSAEKFVPAAIDAETAVAPSTIHPPRREKIGCRDHAPVLQKRNLQAQRADAPIGKNCRTRELRNHFQNT
jgi:hypothetical protein